MITPANEELRFPRVDKRLFGTWKSDNKRTFLDWNWSKDRSAKQKARLKSLFGNLEITFTKIKIIYVLRQRKWEASRPYKVLGFDDSKTAIAVFGEFHVKNSRRYVNLEMLNEAYSKPEIKLVNFDKSCIWMSFGNGRNREFFRKIRSKGRKV